jgi:hypothetical protein
MHQGNKITDSETQPQRIWMHKNQQEKNPEYNENMQPTTL